MDVNPIANIDFQNVQKQDLSILYSYKDLKKELQTKPIDFLRLHEIQIEIGKLGEAFVYEYEYNKLIGTKYINYLDEKKALDPSNGYDILSYTKEGIPLHIEVKCTVSSENTFFFSENELKTAKRMKEEGLVYLIYFIQEIMSDKPRLTIIEDITVNNDYVFEAMNWKVSKNEIYSI